MKTEKKFFLEPEDGPETARQCILESEGSAVIINIPKKSVIGKKAQNFRELKDLCDEAGKELAIESTDDHILELAAETGIRAVNPVWRVRERAVSDIIPVSSAVPKKPAAGDETEAVLIPGKYEAAAKPDVSVIFASKARAEENKNKIKSKKEKARETFFTESADEEENAPEKNNRREKTRKFKKNAGKKIIFASSALIIVLAAVFIVFFALPKANITIVLKKIPVSFNESVEISSVVTAADISTPGKTRVPGEFFDAKKNTFAELSSDEKKYTEEKARGFLTVYNSWSSAPQALVETTRFESPGGIIFRLDKAVTVPGAKTENGKLAPSQIDVAVTADKAGPSSNLSPQKNWTVPGFKDTSRFNGFSAENKNAMSGGFAGDAPVVSNDSKQASLKQAEEMLKGLLSGEMSVLMSDDLKIIKGTDSFQITKNELQPSKSNPGGFGIFVEGEMKRMVFKESTLENAIFEKYGAPYFDEGYDSPFSFSLLYGTSTVDFENKKITVPVSGLIEYAIRLDKDILIENLKGKSESELRQIIFSLQGVENATISLWPFWVKTVPSSSSKIKIEIK